jgi:hypothetical protein
LDLFSGHSLVIESSSVKVVASPGFEPAEHLISLPVPSGGHCQSKFVYFAKTSEPDFAAIDFPAFSRVDLSGSMAAPSI